MQNLTAVPQQTIVSWATQRAHEQGLARAALHIAREVANPLRSWPDIIDEFSRWLVAGFDGIRQLRELVDNMQSVPASERLVQWMQWAGELEKLWPVTQPDDWKPLFSAALNNRLIAAVITRSLADCPKSKPLDVGLRESLDDLVTHDQQWFIGLPVPPAAGRTFVAQAYFQAGQSTAIACSLATLSKKISVFREEMEAVIRGQRSDRPAAELSQLLNAIAELTNSRAEWSQLTGYVTQGWPVESRRLVDGLSRIAAALEQLAACTPPAWHAANQTLFVETSALRDQFLQHLSTVSASEPSDAHHPRDLDTLRLDRHLTRWADELGGQTDEAAAGIADRLRTLARLSGAGDSPTSSADSQFARQLLTVLMAVDIALARPKLRTALLEVQSGLRRLLFEGHSRSDYVLLDKDLVGQPLANWLDYVDVAGTVSGSHTRRDCIAEVNRPGYVFRGSQETVLRPAIVLVAE
jgi:hypothetical protein